MGDGVAVGSGGSDAYTWFWSSRGGGVRGFGNPSGCGGGSLIRFRSPVGESRGIGGGSDDSLRTAEWSGVFKEVVEAFWTLSGSLNGLFVAVELEYEVEAPNSCFMVGVLAPEGGGVRSRSSRGRLSSFSLSGSA